MPASTPLPPRIGTLGAVIHDRYRLEKPIAVGGMSVVYEASDAQRDDGKRFALKLTFLGENPAAQSRFLREARLTTSLQHPNIVQIHDVGVLDDGHGFLALELLSGQTLHDAIREATLYGGEVKNALCILDRLLDALLACHLAGIIHRDFTPANVFLDRSAPETLRPVLIDFGLGKGVRDTERLTGDGELLGAPAYVAPEQIFQEELDERVDVYGFGITAYETLSRTRLFRGETFEETAERVLNETPPALHEFGETEPQISRIVARCLSKNREHRYRTAESLLEAWREARSTEKPASRRTTRP